MHTGITIDADFECGSAGIIRKQNDGTYTIEAQSEEVPLWFNQALEQHFGGAGVPREYAFCIRVRSDENKVRPLRLRFSFTKTNGSAYMDPPYWYRRGRRWRPVLAAATRFEKGKWAEIEIEVGPGDTVYLANKPYVSPDEVEEEIDDLVELYDVFTKREIGRTAKGRPLWALETTERDETLVVGATLQPAEPAARPVLAVAHALADGSAGSRRMLERFRFCFTPMPNPDGSAEGRSVSNALGEVPMFSFDRAVEGRAAPAETRFLWEYMAAIRPAGHIEFHTHYQDVRSHKLNPMGPQWYGAAGQARLEQVNQTLLRLNRDWRVTPLTPDLPLVDCGKFAQMARHLGTLTYCYQIYALSEEATCAHAVKAVEALAAGLAGGEWAEDQEAPRIVRG
jgi:hypothetical protein